MKQCADLGIHALCFFIFVTVTVKRKRTCVPPSPPGIFRPLGNVSKYRKLHILTPCSCCLKLSLPHVMIRNGEACVIGHRPLLLPCASVSLHSYPLSTFLIKLNEFTYRCVLKYDSLNSSKLSGFKLTVQMQEKLARVQFVSSCGRYLLPFLFKCEYPLPMNFPPKFYRRQKW